MNYIEKAKNYAQKIHANQKRSDGKPYFSHLETVVRLLSNDRFSYFKKEAMNNVNDNWEHIVAAAYLHDSMEDQGVTEEILKEEGFSVLTIELVKTLTRQPVETYFDFIIRIRDSRFATGIKLADLDHNMFDLEEGSRKDKYRFARYILKRGIS
jgi:(p)ppGpp synthase/HD superfamily hydrolase